jgi:arylsulfatase A-like enzyme
VWDGNCEPANDAGFAAQTLCATRLIGEITSELKRLRRYEDSLIVFQSDHGFHDSGDEAAAFTEFPPEVQEKLTATARYFDPKGVFRRLHALLLIKPPQAKAAPLRVSAAPTQLVDVPATIYELADLRAPGFDGKSVYSLTATDSREIHVFIGIYDVKAGRTLVLGHNIGRKDLAHISYQAGAGWRVHPDVTATHEGW